MEQWFDRIIAGACTIALGVIGFFLKRVIDRVDENEANIEEIVKTLPDYVRQGDLEKVERSTANALNRMEKRMDERLNNIEQELKGMRTHYITKDEFVTQIAKLSAQNDKIYDMLYNLARERST